MSSIAAARLNSFVTKKKRKGERLVTHTNWFTTQPTPSKAPLTTVV